MKQASFSNFHVGQALNPSVEDQGGFEFASGMDVFSEPGVMKAAHALQDVGLAEGLSLSVLPRCMLEVMDGPLPVLYAAVGGEIWVSDNGIDFAPFIEGSEGTILGLAAWNGYVLYATDRHIGRVEIGNAASQDDDYIGTGDGLVDDDNYHPMAAQGGTLKVGNGRYVASLDESFAFTAQAMRMPEGYTAKCMAEFMGRLFVGAVEGQGDTVTSSRATVFEWRGVLPATGSALPDAAHSLNLAGVHALASNGTDLYAFPGTAGDVWAYTGAGFRKAAQTFPVQTQAALGVPLIEIYPHSVTARGGSLLYGGQFQRQHGVFELRDGRVSQPYVPPFLAPGENAAQVPTTRVVFSGFLGGLYVASEKNNPTPTPDEVFLQYLGVNRRDGAACRTLWHRVGTDRMKRFAGIRLNLKPMPAGTAVTVAYRTGRAGAFTAAPHPVTAANQRRPVLFPVRPRAHEIQFRLTFTTSGPATPELTSYDVLFDTLNSTR